MGGFFHTLMGEDALTACVTIFALIVVWVPFVRGMRVTFQAWTATRHMDRASLVAALPRESREDVEPLAVLMLRIFRDSLASGEEHSPEFVFDASRQYVMNEFEVNYTRLITMFGEPASADRVHRNHRWACSSCSCPCTKSDTTLELGALALALTSSIFALIAYAILEGIKIRLYTRLMQCLREVEHFRNGARATLSPAGGAQAQQPARAPA